MKDELNNSVDQLSQLQQGSKGVSSHQSEKHSISEPDDPESNDSFVLPEGNNLFYICCLNSGLLINDGVIFGIVYLLLASE